MIDDLRSDDGLGKYEGRARRTNPAEAAQHPLADREVPLRQLETESRVLSPAIHAWLDGELPEASVRRGDTARDVEFWNRVTADADRRRRLVTPLYLEARIMEALPQTAPQIITPWWRREFVVTPSKAATAVAAVVAVTALVTFVLMHAAG